MGVGAGEENNVTFHELIESYQSFETVTRLRMVQTHGILHQTVHTHHYKDIVKTITK